MRILLTNDDGITSEGLWAAARGLARVGRVAVIGTLADWSGCGAAIQLPRGTVLRRFRDVPDGVGPNVDAYAIGASPGAAVLAGLMSGLFEPFDLVASGANLGLNVGTDLNHSGTVGAAVTAYGRGVTAFAISTDRGAPRGEPQHWEGTTDVAERVARWLGHRLGPPLLLNVNVPNRPFEQMDGAAIVPPVAWGNLDRTTLLVESDGVDGWVLGARIDRSAPYPSGVGTDAGVVMAGRVALTPISLSHEPIADHDTLAGLVEALNSFPVAEAAG